MVALLKFLNQGVHPSIRGEVWEFLLGCYDPKSTFEEREQIRHHRRLQIFLSNGLFYKNPLFQPYYCHSILKHSNFL